MILPPPLRDFRNFMFVVWNHLGLPDPTVRQYEFGDYIQNAKGRVLGEGHRGLGKSTILGAYAPFFLAQDPSKKILAVSGDASLAGSFTTFALNLILEMDLLEWLRPHRNQRQSTLAFDVGPAGVARDPSMKSVGIMGRIVGSHADLIVADDVETPNNSETIGQREKLATRVKELTGAILNPGGSIVWLGTPQNDDTVYEKIVLDDRRFWPARYPGNGYGNLDVYKGHLAPSLVAELDSDPTLAGRPIDEARFDEVDLREREAEYGLAGFRLQFMLDTSESDSEKRPLRLDDLVVMPLNASTAPVGLSWGSGPDRVIKDLPTEARSRLHSPFFVSPHWTEYQSKVMFIDPAGRGKDETAYAIVGLLHGNLYLIDWGGWAGVGYDDEAMDWLVEAAERAQVKTIVAEDNFGNGMFTKLLQAALVRAEYKASVQEVTSTTAKEKRIVSTLAGVTQAHRLIVNEDAVRREAEELRNRLVPSARTYGLMHQIARVRPIKGSLAHDDRLDALAGAVRFFADALAADREASIRASREAEWEEMERDEFRLLGPPQTPPGNAFGNRAIR